MKNSGIKIQEWLRAAFRVPIGRSLAASRTENRRTNRMHRLMARRRALHPRCVHLEFVNRRARRVAIAGSFNDWRPAVTPMVPMGGGWWVKGLALPPGRYEYRLVVDGWWIPDPNAAETVPARDGRNNSVLVVPAQNGG